MVTSPGCSRTVQRGPVTESGIDVRMTPGRRRRPSSSEPVPATVTCTGGGGASRRRSAGTATSSATANSSVWTRSVCTRTYNSRASASAASLMGQLSRTRRPSLPRIEQAAHQDGVHGIIPLDRADHLLDDDAFAVDQEALGDAGGLIETLHVRGLVVEDVERQAQLLHERLDDLGPILVDAHGDDV